MVVNPKQKNMAIEVTYKYVILDILKNIPYMYSILLDIC